MNHAGEFAALAAAAFWAGGSLFFSFVAVRAGAFALNIFRITLAFVILTTLVLASGLGPAIPRPDDPAFLWLGLSGFIGLVLGDLCFFGALRRMGPRLATLMQAGAPPLTALLAWIFLGEDLGLLGLAGMVLTFAGGTWVVLERRSTPAPPGHHLQGVLLGLAGAACQAVGLVLARQGMGTAMPPLVATNIRMAAALAGIWAIALATGRTGAPLTIWRDPPVRRAALVASIVGPVLGVWLSLVAVQEAGAAVAAVLTSTVPVLVLPLVIVFHRERVSPRAAIGACLAVAGVALIFLRH